MFGHIATGQASRERGVACAALAELRWRQGRLVEAGAMLARAAQDLAEAHAVQAMTTCHVLHGLLLVSTRDLMLGRLELLKVERLLDVRLAPSLGVAAALGLACCEAGTGRTVAAQRQLGRARWLTTLVPEGSRVVPRLWQELAAAEHAAGEEAEGAGRSAGPVAGPAAEAAPLTLASLDTALVGLLAARGDDGPAWSRGHLGDILILADRLLLGRAEDEPALGLPRQEDGR